MLLSVGTEVAWVFGSLLLLLLTLAFIRWSLALFPLPPRVVASLSRYGNWIVSGALILWLIGVMTWMLRHYPWGIGASFVTVGLLVIVLSWASIRDVIEGVYLRTSRFVSVGDTIETPHISGRIRAFHLRAVLLETNDGKIAHVRYSHVTHSTLTKVPTKEQTSVHVFTVAAGERSIVEAKDIILQAALLQHWSSVKEMPRCVPKDDDKLEVTVYALDPDRAIEVEHSIREALG